MNFVLQMKIYMLEFKSVQIAIAQYSFDYALKSIKIDHIGQNYLYILSMKRQTQFVLHSRCYTISLNQASVWNEMDVIILPRFCHKIWIPTTSTSTITNCSTCALNIEQSINAKQTILLNQNNGEKKSHPQHSVTSISYEMPHIFELLVWLWEHSIYK